jgi:hypothetical protein
MRGGYWREKEAAAANGIKQTISVYVPDTREEYCNSIKMLYLFVVNEAEGMFKFQEVLAEINKRVEVIEKAKAEFRKEKAGIYVSRDNPDLANNNTHSELLTEDKQDGIATYLVGGTEDGDILLRNIAMPMNAHLEHLGNVYTLAEDGRLHFNEEQTRRLQSQRVKG